MVSLSDLVDGPKMFRETFGPKWGPRWWRVFFVIVVLAVASAAAEEIGGVGSRTVAAARGWFSPPSTVNPSSTPLQPPVNTQKCVITGGTNNGTQIQNCL
jgi:hypothetical protein